MLHYQIYEKEPALPWVTFVHGAGGSSSIWFRQLRAFREHFNVLLLDLRGHGSSAKPADAFKEAYTFDSIAKDILDVLDRERIAASHFVGISLGTILIRHIAESNPARVQSMILGGAILKLNARSQFLMRMGNLFKSVLPYLWLYKFFAFIIMPNKNHRESRSLFIREAKKLYQKEFIRWFRLTAQINPLLRWFRSVEPKIPALYIMGEQDYMFLPSIQKAVAGWSFSRLEVVKECGHVVNVERAEEFNRKCIAFIKGLHKKTDC